jgi:hypothetical protein
MIFNKYRQSLIKYYQYKEMLISVIGMLIIADIEYINSLTQDQLLFNRI